MAKQSVVLLGNKFGPEHPDVVRSPANLATLNYGQGRYADAEPLSKRALTLDDKAVASEYPEVAQEAVFLLSALRHGAEGDPARRVGSQCCEDRQPTGRTQLRPLRKCGFSSADS
jgi:hypothetical protein